VGKFSDFETDAMKGGKSLVPNKRFKVAYLCVVAVEILKAGDVPKRL
jgi:hypothetical protein